MGTRNLTMVVHEGKIKLAKYCQWDGYFKGGAGEDILNFLNTEFKPEIFLKKLAKIKVLTDQEQINVGFAEGEPSYWLSRDCSGAKALAAIQSGKMDHTYLSSDFAYDSLFCEFAYLLDLDRYVFEVYTGFNKKKLPQSARFYKDKPNDTGYYAVRKLVEYPFDKLPKHIEKIEALLTQE